MKTNIRRIAIAVAAMLGAAAFTSAANAHHTNNYYQRYNGVNSVNDVEIMDFPRRYRRGSIVVSFADRRLYFVSRRGEAVSYPIAVPKPEARWSGVERVTKKRKNPRWTPTKEMRAENPDLPDYVEGGDPKNPLGVRAIYLGSTLYRIHGTDAPWTIGKNVSKGCIRMHNEHVLELYPQVRKGAKVYATYKRFGGRRYASN